MARFYGKVGYVETSETAPGVWTEEATERNYRGDVIQNIRRLEEGASINDNVKVNNAISVVADAYAYTHFHAIRYVEFMGSLWKVSAVEVEHPRLKMTLGGLYNG